MTVENYSCIVHYKCVIATAMLSCTSISLYSRKRQNLTCILPNSFSSCGTSSPSLPSEASPLDSTGVLPSPDPLTQLHTRVYTTDTSLMSRRCHCSSLFTTSRSTGVSASLKVCLAGRTPRPSATSRPAPPTVAGVEFRLSPGRTTGGRRFARADND